MKKIIYFHRNLKAGFSINKVTQTFVSFFADKEEFFMPFYGASPFVILKNLFFTINKRNKKEINHITGDIHYCILALIGCKSILTIHDTVGVDYLKNNKLFFWYIKYLWFIFPLKIATKIVCISDETKKQVKKYTGRNDILVIHNAIDPSFKTVLKDQTNVPYKVLIIGTTANKNIERTIEALKGIKCHLTIIGRLTDLQKQKLKDAEIFYTNKFDLTDDQIIQEYIDTDVVSFISLFEGFGMPIIEANKVGRPIITSNIPVLKEISGGSCVHVNPMSVENIRSGFIRLFSDVELRQQCVKRGLENVDRFDIKNIAKQWENLYNSIS